MTERAIIGTRLGGSAEQLHELATWLNFTVASQVEAAASRLGALRDDIERSWTDLAGVEFAALLENGRRAAHRLADQLEALGNLTDNCGHALHQGQRDLSALWHDARDDGLEVTAQGVLAPGGAPPSGMPIHDPQQLSDYRERENLKFAKYGERADQALTSVARVLVEVHQHNESVWGNLVFPTASLVNAESQYLAQAYAAKFGADMGPYRYWESYWRTQAASSRGISQLERLAQSYAEADHKAWASARFGAKNAGLTARVFGAFGYVIAGLEVHQRISRGEREGKVFLEVGVGLGVSAGASALAGVALAGGAIVSGGAILLLGAGAAFIASSIAGAAYDTFVPMTAREKLFELGAGDYSTRGSVEPPGTD